MDDCEFWITIKIAWRLGRIPRFGWLLKCVSFKTLLMKQQENENISRNFFCRLVTKSCITLLWLLDCGVPGFSAYEFFKQEYWSGLSFPSPGGLPNPETELTPPALQADSLPLSHLGSPSILLFKIWVLYLQVIFPQVSSLESSFPNRSFGLHFIFFSSPWWLRR